MISPAERMGTEESVMSRIRARMRRLDTPNTRATLGEQGDERARVAAPQDGHQGFPFPGDQGPDGLLGHLLPALAAVRGRMPRLNGQHPVEQQHAALGPRGQVPVRRPREAEVRGVLGEDVEQARRQPPHLGRDREAQPDRMAGRGIRVLADDEHAHVVERLLERPQHVVPGRQVPAPGRDLRPQELAHRGDLVRDGLQCPGPASVDDVAQRLCHDSTVSAVTQKQGTERSGSYALLTPGGDPPVTPRLWGTTRPPYPLGPPRGAPGGANAFDLTKCRKSYL